MVCILVAFGGQYSCSSVSYIDKQDDIILRYIESLIDLLCRKEITVERLLMAVGSENGSDEEKINLDPFFADFNEGAIFPADKKSQVVKLELKFGDPGLFGYRVFDYQFGPIRPENVRRGFEGKYLVENSTPYRKPCAVALEMKIVTKSRPGPQNPDPNVYSIKLIRH